MSLRSRGMCVAFLCSSCGPVADGRRQAGFQQLDTLTSSKICSIAEQVHSGRKGREAGLPGGRPCRGRMIVGAPARVRRCLRAPAMTSCRRRMLVDGARLGRSCRDGHGRPGSDDLVVVPAGERTGSPHRRGSKDPRLPVCPPQVHQSSRPKVRRHWFKSKTVTSAGDFKGRPQACSGGCPSG